VSTVIFTTDHSGHEGKRGERRDDALRADTEVAPHSGHVDGRVHTVHEHRA
jgi:hypothetical protein